MKGECYRACVAMLSHTFDFIENIDDDALFDGVGGNVVEAEVSIYQLLATVSVYASGLAILVSAILLIINSISGGTKLAEAKSYVLRVLIISICIFGVSGMVSMVLKMGF